jgi:mannose-6-phosphate isomerase-like protein (cupin superfamily)
MKTYDPSIFSGGWFIGSFTPSVVRTKDFEVCYKFHPKGEQWPEHYHKLSDEINYLIEGEMTIDGVTTLKAPLIFVIEKNDIAKPEFFTDCKLIVVKIPSIPGDKILINSPPDGSL